ncbi:MAG TPA: IPT/TIG domain-containing protein [Jatrophihabitans sp.]
MQDRRVCDATVLVAVASIAFAGQSAVAATPAKSKVRAIVDMYNPAIASTAGESTVVLFGHNFSAKDVVYFGATKARKTKLVSAKKIGAVAPAHSAGRVAMYVREPGKPEKKIGLILFAAPPKITDVPGSVQVSTTANRPKVTFHGSGLYYSNKITVGGRRAAPDGYKKTSLTFTPPKLPVGTYPVIVSGPTGTTQTTLTYYGHPGPVITSLSPSSGPSRGGTLVAITGTNLDRVTSVMIGGYAAGRISASPTSITVQTPAHAAGAAAVVVNTSYGTSAPGSFTYYLSSSTSPTPATTTGAISGVVTAAGGTPLQDVQVDIYTPANMRLWTYTAADGTYAVDALAPGNYRVCFTSDEANGGPSDAGYFDKCNGGLDWDGDYSDIPSSIQLTAVTTGSTTTANAVLDAASAVVGEVYNADGYAIDFANVTLFQNGQEIASDTISAYPQDDQGWFEFDGLHAGSYSVCVDASDVPTDEDEDAPLGYENQCFDGGDWDPEATTLLAASANMDSFPLATGEAGYVEIDLDPRPVATISGTVTASDGSGLQGVQVELLGPRWVVNRVQTDASGRYTFTVAAGIPYYVCFVAVGDNGPLTSGGPSAGGYQNTCSGSPSVWPNYDSVTSWSGPAPVPAGSTTVTPAADEIATVDETLPSLSKLTVQVSNPYATGTQYIELYLVSSAGPYGRPVPLDTDDGNNWSEPVSFTALPPGSYTVCAQVYLSLNDDNSTDPQGYQSACYDHVDWPDYTALDSIVPAPTPITLSAGDAASVAIALQPKPVA